jgi:hypothetical protein
MLHRYFAHTEETDAQLATLSRAAITLMGSVLRPLGDLITTLPVGPEHPGMTAGPSFELFYESDYLMPHRAAAWALLEERLRDAANFCNLIQESSDESVAGELDNVRTALLRVADSLASHFDDWGAVSRFAAREPAKQNTVAGDASDTPSVLPSGGEPIRFEDRVKTLFRTRDRQSMLFVFDLWSYDDVAAHADEILERVRAGTMPCDGAWPQTGRLLRALDRRGESAMRAGGAGVVTPMSHARSKASCREDLRR